MEITTFAAAAYRLMQEKLNQYRNSIPRKAVETLVAEIVYLAAYIESKEEQNGKEN